MYCLDSNVVIDAISKKTFSILLPHFKSLEPDEICIPSIVVAELEYGAAKSQNHLREHMAVLNFVSPFDILNFTPKDAENFGLIRAYLEKKGIPIGPYDLEIAAQAMTRDLTVVTHNNDEFSRIPWIRVEDWTR